MRCVRRVRAAGAGVHQQHEWSQSVFISSVGLQESAIVRRRSFPPTVGNAPHALDCFSPDKSGDERREIAAPPLPGPLTQHACQSGAVEWSRNSGACFNTSAQPLTWTHVNLDGGLWVCNFSSDTPRLPDSAAR